MISVGAYEAKTHLPALLKRVENGELVTITRHHRPIARLLPAESNRSGTVAETIAAIRLFRKGKKLAGVPLRTLIAEGRR